MKHIGQYRTISKAQTGPGGLTCSCCNPRVGRLNGEGAKANKVRLRRMYRRTTKNAVVDEG